MKRNIITITVIFVLVGIALYTNVLKGNGTNVMRPEEGFKAPELELASLDNRNFNLDQMDKPVLLNFWASWCGPCREEAPALVKMYNKYKGQVEFLAIDLTTGDQLDNVKEFVNTYHYSFPVLLDPKGIVADRYQVRAIPTSFFIDKNKRIVKIAKGMQTDQEFDKNIQALLSHK